MITWLEPQPAPDAVPAAMSSPFDEVAPHPLAQAQAEALMAGLRGGLIAPEVSTALLHQRPEGGKMFGVLLVRDAAGRVGVLRAFSGQLGKAWNVPGYAPPLFDVPAREAVEPASDVAVKALTAQLEALAASPALVEARAALAAFDRQHAGRRAELKRRHAERRELRHLRRASALNGEAALRASGDESCAVAAQGDRRPVAATQDEEGRTAAPEGEEGRAAAAQAETRRSAAPHGGERGSATQDGEGRSAAPEGDTRRSAARQGETGCSVAPRDVAALRALDDESRLDDLERRKLEAAARTARAPLAAAVEALELQLDALERRRRATSQEAMRRIHDCYLLRSAKGEAKTLRALFAPGEPPWGAADCAAPKLIGFALGRGLTPLALAEFWWGPPPPGGGRVEGMFFPACKEKCGPVLPFLLSGLEVRPRQTWRPREVGADELQLVHQDGRVVVITKPPGLLSVPARDEAVTDSVLARLRRRYPRAAGPLLVHRLDLDTSGLLVAALDEEAHRLLQAQFLSRAVEKRYVAWLEGEVRGERGTVELPLRVDLEQRPRQLVDFVHGKPATTDWEVLERRGGWTRVAFFPRTGRTHQLRVHAAHRLGLGVPIVGDRLYGRPGERLMLHAESIRFTHPGTGEPFTVVAPAPF